MNTKKTILSTFAGDKENNNKVIWQPRFENWYNVNSAHDNIPKKYEGISLLELYDELKCVPRPYLVPNPSPEDLRQEISDKWKGFCPQDAPPILQIKSDSTVDGEIEITGDGREGDFIIEKWATPKGSLTRKWLISEASISQRVSEYPIKGIEDLKKLEYILNHQKWEFDLSAYRDVKKRIGDRAPIVAVAPRAPFIQYLMFYLDYEDAIKNLFHKKGRIEQFLQIAEEADKQAFEVIKESPVELVLFPTNLDGQLVSPPLFKEYILPHYHRYGKMLQNAGKYVYAHWDGRLKPLLQFAKQTNLDGLEALTPEPQGDVSIEEIKKALGNEIIYLDGIPATLFLSDQYNVDTLLTKTKELIKKFAPNIILGISDELPANGDIERVKLVSDLVKDVNNQNLDSC